MPTAIVLGASGPLGSYAVEHLVASGFEVVGVSRRPSAALPASNIRWLTLDVTRNEDLEFLPPFCTLVSTLPVWATAQVCHVLRMRGAMRVVAFSSTSAVSKAEATSQDERALSSRLLEGERSLMAMTPDVSTTIFRPTMIYSDRGDRNVERLVRQVQGMSVFPAIGGGRGLRQPVHADDLAKAAVAALVNPMTIGRSYDLGGREVLSFRDMLSRAAKVNGVSVKFLPVPLNAAQWTLHTARLLNLQLVRGIPAGALERMTKDLVCDIQKAEIDFGYSPRMFEPPRYVDGKVTL